MPIVQPNSRRSDELPDIAWRGPFGGIQTEVPLDDVEDIGFADCLNIMFKHSQAFPRPPANPLPLIPNPQEPWVGVADFFTVAGNRVQVALTPTRLLQWTGGGWVVIPGVLTGGAGDLFTWSVVAGKLYFCQGVDKVKMWDGVAGAFVDAAAAAVPGKYLFELDNHLVVCNTIEGGLSAPQRIRWTGIDDGTDWVSFEAGQMDLFNDLGPITGGVKLYQSGFVFHQWGITQLVITGNGLAPFYRIPLSAHSKGCICPHSLAAFGEDMAAYVSKDNVYVFDGSNSEPIGERPLQGPRRIGAWGGIVVDLLASNLDTVFGYISTSINGQRLKAYWLFTNVSIWLYNFDEGNWTRLSYSQGMPTIAGTFDKQAQIRIMDLIGTIQQQNWSPANLTGANPLDSMFIGFDGGEPSIVDFTGVCEQDAYIESGQCYFGDRRHSKSVKRFLIKFVDQGPVSFTLTVTNEDGQSVTKTRIYGSNTGKVIRRQIAVNISGEDITWKLTIPAGQPTKLVEIRPVFDIGGETRTKEAKA